MVAGGGAFDGAFGGGGPGKFVAIGGLLWPPMAGASEASGALAKATIVHWSEASEASGAL